VHLIASDPSNAAVIPKIREDMMQIRGIVRTSTLQENPPGTDRIEMVLQVQGVGPAQPRRLVIPYELLLADPELDPDLMLGKGFQAEIDQDAEGRWVVAQIGFATDRVLRPPE
jgi:hypothetical protein